VNPQPRRAFRLRDSVHKGSGLNKCLVPVPNSGRCALIQP
jgi:hypothetical protein